MYICPVLLYKCYLSVYSPFLLIVEVHSVACFDACVWGGWTKAMCLVRPHTSGASLYKSCENQTIKCTKCALWVTDLPHLHHRHLAYLSKSLVTAPVSLGLCEINFQKNKIKNKKISLTSHNSLRGTGSTFDISQHERRVSPCRPSQYQKRLFAINVHCKKNYFYRYTVFRASLFLLLRWSSPLDAWNFLRSVKCWIGLACLGFCAFFFFKTKTNLQSSRGLRL